MKPTLQDMIIKVIPMASAFFATNDPNLESCYYLVFSELYKREVGANFAKSLKERGLHDEVVDLAIQEKLYERKTSKYMNGANWGEPELLSISDLMNNAKLMIRFRESCTYCLRNTS